ncbi:hypothetical protein J4N45_10215 [Vibrio sp. SCSIO 43140]|uniref:hypothetical protein n=1 Tax=Vibrio sp. SCSIO 43140 TaxID=2819100 RepID=UPI002075C1E6|nr:hypothetical protein [Vibrio sp. SCSIO 43140]USD58903.1 hypothetical protein J4N45_10215 [Vibrio sp. SCSIO 43140]
MSPQTLEQTANNLVYALIRVREAGGKPLSPYQLEGGMDACDHAQASIVDTAKVLSIDLGHHRFNLIDLRGVER